MIPQLRSELLKLRTIRTVAVLLLVAGALSVFVSFAGGLSNSIGDLAKEDMQREMFVARVAMWFSMFAGLILVTNEFRYGTIRSTLLFEPRRRVVLAAKLAAAALAGVLFTVVGVAVSFGAGLFILAVRNVGFVLTGGHVLALVIGGIAAGAVGAMLGVAVGTLIRHQVGAIVAIAAYFFVIEGVLFAAVPSVGRYLPGEASYALAGAPTAHLLAPLIAGAVYVAWTLALITAATVRNDHSDI